MSKKHTSLSQFKHVELIANLFGGDLLGRILDGREEGCREKDRATFLLSEGLEVHNEAQRAYLNALGGWNQLMRISSLDLEATQSFIHNLLQHGLGYDYRAIAEDGVRISEEVRSDGELFAEEEVVEYGEEKSFELSAYLAPTVKSDASIPLLILPYMQDLDKSYTTHTGTRFVPFFYMQEYLNKSEKHLWGIVTNGRHWRLLRDNNSLSRPSYVDFDMECVLSEKNAAAFAGIYRCLHSSRAYEKTVNDRKSCLWEAWHRQLEETGQRVREGLRDGVERALCTLGAGFLSSNEQIREQLRRGELSPTAYYNELLHLVYRIIFLFVLEEKQLLHKSLAPSDAVERYQQGYSLSRLVQRALSPDTSTRYNDLWLGCQLVFNALGSESGEELLALSGIGGIFKADQCPHLQGTQLSNQHFLLAIQHLHWAVVGGQRSRVDYKNMGAEELGSIYESLLELTPSIDIETSSFGFLEISGNQRKTTGSYYTPDMLVRQILSTTLDPLITEKISQAPQGKAIEELLSLRIVDPACGSGHFLLAAARRLAETVAKERSAEGQISEYTYRKAMHDVISQCIYGVDINPMAVELVRMNLWMEGHVPGQALSFLDHHIRCGNSLLGLHSWEGLEWGIPDDAYKAREGDVEAVCSELSKTNKKQRKKGCDPKAILPGLRPEDSPLDEAQPSARNISDAERQEEEYQRKFAKNYKSPNALAADALLGAFLLVKNSEATVPTNEELFSLLETGQCIDAPAVLAARCACEESQVFHWPLHFPSVMEKGGFDCVIGNPPWEKLTFNEQEWFGTRNKIIADAVGDKRKKMIKRLSTGDLDAVSDEAKAVEINLYSQYVRSLRLLGAQSSFYHVTEKQKGQFPLSGRGIANLYALFAERCLKIACLKGRVGIIVPTGIASDDSTKYIFGHLVKNNRLGGLYDFENREKIFPAVDSRVRFSCLTMAEAAQASFAVYLHKEEDLEDDRRHYQLSAEEILSINPNTGTCPMFRCKKDTELTQGIYSRVPILLREEPYNNPWGIKFKMMLNMTSDSHMFLDSPRANALPLYEGKLIHQFDHRWATYLPDGKSADCTLDQKKDSDYEISSRYWVDAGYVQEKLGELYAKKSYLIGFRDIARATDERTCIATLMPMVAVGNSLPLLFTDKSPKLDCCIYANLNALIFDYFARQKVGGTHMNLFIFKQLPAIDPEQYSESDITYISQRVLELSYTSESMRPFAEEMGYMGDPFVFDEVRRQQLRAELDAYYAKLYGLTREDLAYILDPTSYYSDGDCPTVTFPGLKKKELKLYGEYRTERLVLAAFDALSDEPWLYTDFYTEDFIYHYIAGAGGQGCSLAELYSAYLAIWQKERRARVGHSQWQERMNDIPLPTEAGFFDLISTLHEDSRIRITRDLRFILENPLEMRQKLALAQKSAELMKGKIIVIDLNQLNEREKRVFERVYHLLAA